MQAQRLPNLRQDGFFAGCEPPVRLGRDLRRAEHELCVTGHSAHAGDVFQGEALSVLGIGEDGVREVGEGLLELAKIEGRESLGLAT